MKNKRTESKNLENKNAENKNTDHKTMENRKTVVIVGTGIGKRSHLTRQAAAVIRNADLFVGEEKVLRKVEEIPSWAEKIPVSEPEKILETIAESSAHTIAVLTEGDPGDVPPEKQLSRALGKLHPGIVPGISMLVYASSRTGVATKGMISVDLSEQNAALLPMLTENRRLFVRGETKLRDRFRELDEAGYGRVTVYIVENPGEDEERVFRGNVKEAAAKDYSPNTVCFLIRENAPRHGRFGIPARIFSGGYGRIYAPEIRASVVSMLQIDQTETIYDIGAGIGSIAAELAFEASEGMVYAVEKDEDLAETLSVNGRRLGVKNMKVIVGTAPEALAHLPAPDAVLIEEPGKRFFDMLQILASRNSHVKLAVLTEEPGTAEAAVNYLEKLRFHVEESVILISRRVSSGERHRLAAEDPMFVIGAVRRTE